MNKYKSGVHPGVTLGVNSAAHLAINGVEEEGIDAARDALKKYLGK